MDGQLWSAFEPLPADTMRERYPEDYDKLTTEPGFLLLRLFKPARQRPGDAEPAP